MNLSLLTFNFHDSFLPMLLNALSTIIGTSPTYPWSFICCCWFTLSKSSVYFRHSVILRRFCVCTLSNNVSMTLHYHFLCSIFVRYWLIHLVRIVELGRQDKARQPPFSSEVTCTESPASSVYSPINSRWFFNSVHTLQQQRVLF